jgi:hypothetical protein
MISINSLSGGKTSSFMAANFKANYNIFSLVRIDDLKCRPKDKFIVDYVSQKLDLDFIATAESDKTLYTMHQLEQKIGENIIWVSGESFDKICIQKKALPNMMMRFCTTEMKLYPIAEWWLKNINEKVDMRIGFRFDEIERSFKIKNDIKIKVGNDKAGRNKWKNFNWRVASFPLIENKIFHYEVVKWAQNSGVIFPEDSNCVGCFWKPFQQLRKNWEDEPLKMQWFSDLEKKHKRRFRKEASYEQIKKIPLQEDFFFGTGSGCQAGFCTD